MNPWAYGADVVTPSDNNNTCRNTQIITLIKDNLCILLWAIIWWVAGHYEAVTVFKEFSQHHGTTTNELLWVLAWASFWGILQYFMKKDQHKQP